MTSQFPDTRSRAFPGSGAANRPVRLTGDAMYQGETPTQILISHQLSPIPSLCKDRADVLPQLDAVYRKMVAKKPEDRYQFMTEVIIALKTCAGRRFASTTSQGDKHSTSFATEKTFLLARGFPRRSGDGCQQAGRTSCRRDLLATSGGSGNQQTTRQRRQTPNGSEEEENARCGHWLGIAGSCADYYLVGEYLWAWPTFRWPFLLSWEICRN